jgi:hypothetical protein
MIGPIRRLFEAHPIACDLHRPVAFYRGIPRPPLADVIAECNLASFRVPTLDKTMPGLWSFGTSLLCLPLHIAFDVTPRRVRDLLASLRDPDGHSPDVVATRRTGRVAWSEWRRLT